jgi:hypothetical protein
MEKTAKRDKPKTEEEKLDEALAETFPASDPLAQTDPAKRIGRTRTPVTGKPRKGH